MRTNVVVDLITVVLRRTAFRDAMSWLIKVRDNGVEEMLRHSPLRGILALAGITMWANIASAVAEFHFTSPTGLSGETNLAKYAIYVLDSIQEYPSSILSRIEKMSYDEFRATEGWNAKMNNLIVDRYGVIMDIDIFGSAFVGKAPASSFSLYPGATYATILPSYYPFAVVVFNTGSGYKFNMLICSAAAPSATYENELLVDFAYFTDNRYTISQCGEDSLFYELWHDIPGWRDFAQPKDSPDVVKVREIQPRWRVHNGTVQSSFDVTVGNITSEKTFYLPLAWLSRYSYSSSTERKVDIGMLEKIGDNGIPVYMSYLFGMNPRSTVPASQQLMVTIGGFDVDGLPIISFSPDQRSNADVNNCVNYTVLGVPSLDDGKWTPLTEDNRASMRFFKAKVDVAN